MQDWAVNPTDPDQAAEMLEEIGRYRMPFGLFGPKKYPPLGVPIYDLPAEYLAWFAVRGFPKGKLGELMRVVYEMKADGLDGVFDVLRRCAGGRTRLRPVRAKEFNFG